MSKRDAAMSGLSSGATSSQPIGDQSSTVPAPPWVAQSPPGDPDSGTPPNPAAHHPHLGPDLQALIGQQLRAVYHEALNEPVPDRFVRLLEELAAKKADGS
jgi:hypothetical protein